MTELAARAALTHRTTAALAGYVALYLAATGCTAARAFPVAVALHGLLILGAAVAYAAAAPGGARPVLLCLLLVSLEQVLALATPYPQLGPAGRATLAGAPFAVGVVVALGNPTLRALLRTSVSPSWGGWVLQGLVALAGVPVGIVAGLQSRLPDPGRLVPAALTAAAVVLFAVLPEEVVFRGLLDPLGFNLNRSWLLISEVALYAGAYAVTGRVGLVLLAAVAGTAAGYFRIRSGCLAGVAAAHAVAATVAVVVLPGWR